jgi:glycosyltransferase involved in cell wall biosynthesis
MPGLANIALVCEGDAESYDKAFSGSAKSLLDHLRSIGHSVVALDVKLRHPIRGIVALRSFALRRAVWQAQFRRGRPGFWARSRRAECLFQRLNTPIDYVLQIGAGFIPPGLRKIPCGLYCDWNAALSIRIKDQEESSVHLLTASDTEAYNEREKLVYERASDVFTFSEVLRRSFLDDYEIAPDRVMTVHAGPNIEPSVIPPRNHMRPAGHRPTVLFIGKEFVRKGGDILLRAFRHIRSKLPDARLLVVGVNTLPTAEEGVELLGVLRKDQPDQFKRLIEAYHEADVFCLPSRLDPFPTVVREAMFFSLPCVTTNIWALPEMVVDNQTGFVVPPNDSESLAARLLQILQDRALGQRLGEGGRQRAEELFTWSETARKMHERIQERFEQNRDS